MKTGQAFGELWSHGARDWASFVEPQYQSLYETVHNRLGIRNGTRLLDVGCGPGGAALLAAGRGARVAGLDASPDSVEVAANEFRVAISGSGIWKAFPGRTAPLMPSPDSTPFHSLAIRWLRWRKSVAFLRPAGKLGMAVFSRREESQQAMIMAAIGALAPPQSPDGPSPFALSVPGAVGSALAAGLQLVDHGEFPIALGYPTAETACRAFIAGGGGAQAIRHSGEERVRRAIQEALERFRATTGSKTAFNL